MTTYNTGNPIGSKDPRDLYDNAENLDVAVNDDAATWVDRLGVQRSTLWQMLEYSKQFNDRGDWLTGTAYARKDYFTYGGVTYVTLTAHTSTSVAADLAAGKIGVMSGNSGAMDFLQAGTGAVKRSVESKLRDVVSVLDFIPVEHHAAIKAGTSTYDCQPAIQAAIDSVASNGTVRIPDGKYILTDKLALSTKNLLGEGLGSELVQNGAAYAIEVVGTCIVDSLFITGSLNALGAIKVNNSGWGEFRNLRIESFRRADALAFAFNITECYRLRIDRAYIYNCDNGIKFSGNVTAFVISKSNFGAIINKAIDATTGANDSLEFAAYSTYFESCGGQYPIHCNLTGKLQFYSCGFEANCNGKANPSVIYVQNPSWLYLQDCGFSGFMDSGITGTASCIELGADAPGVTLTNCSFTQNYAMTGYTVKWIKNLGANCTVVLTNNNYTGTAWADAYECASAMAFNTVYNPKKIIINDIYRRSFILNNVHPHSTSKDIVSITTTGTLLELKLPKEYFGKGNGFRLTGFGHRLGDSVATKDIVCEFTAAATHTLPVTATKTANDMFRFEVICNAVTYSGQNISVHGFDGTEVVMVNYILNENTNTDYPIIKLIGRISGAGSEIKLLGYIFQLF